uniref:Uncharacterized protein n=1 Tax=Anguilla anguilla TaxID=7936 RepID=A0A0E9T5E2_ANGAN
MLLASEPHLKLRCAGVPAAADSDAGAASPKGRAGFSSMTPLELGQRCRRPFLQVRAATHKPSGPAGRSTPDRRRTARRV